MILSSRNVLVSILSCGAIAAVVIACGSTGSTFQPPGPTNPGFTRDSGFGEAGPPQDDITRNDPPPPWCGPDSGVPQPPPITGTAECPDDKNLPGCGCKNVGDKAACWTGYRKQRHLGNCKDGTTTCVGKDEVNNVWGPCVGEVLPVKDQATGKDACGCFSIGEWKIDNTAPCNWTNDGTNYFAFAATFDGSGNTTDCALGKIPPVGVAPSGIWSTDTLKVDCAGTFKLCFKIKAGDYNNPQPTDCELGEVCVDAEYTTPNVEQKLPDLVTWAGKDPACSKKWEHDTPNTVSPGYGEMVVRGKSFTCDAIDDGNGNDFVFHRVQYCPSICRDPAHATDAACVSCQLNAKATF
jgi:hypothetical protein